MSAGPSNFVTFFYTKCFTKAYEGYFVLTRTTRIVKKASFGWNTSLRMSFIIKSMISMPSSTDDMSLLT